MAHHRFTGQAPEAQGAEQAPRGATEGVSGAAALKAILAPIQLLTSCAGLVPQPCNGDSTCLSECLERFNKIPHVARRKATW